MTDELISKTDVVKIVKSVLSPASSLINVARARRQMLTEIDELESKPEPHTGYWEPVGMAEAVGGESAMWGSAIAYHVCSECREQALEEGGEEKLSNFCPYCGAKTEQRRRLDEYGYEYHD